MKTRIISGAVMLAVFIPCLILSHTVLFDIVISLLCLMAVFEMLGCIKMRSSFAVSVPAYIVAAITPLCIRIVKTDISVSEMLVLVSIILMFWVLGVAVFSHGKLDVMRASSAFCLIFYVVFGISSVLAIRALEGGEFLYILVMISAWITDTGAYFTGVFFGKTKLIPDVSPKKTVEGALGGIASCVFAFIVYGLIVQFAFEKTPNYFVLILVAVIASLVSMCGDLIASLIKRRFNIKDYSNLIPGHGGVMDRFDSIIATASILFVLLNIPFIYNGLI